MKKKAITIFLLLLCTFSLYANNFFFQREDYIENAFSQEVEKSISNALNSTLVAYTKVDDSLLSSIKIVISKLEYKDSNFKLVGQVILDPNSVPLNIQFVESDENKVIELLDKVLFNTFNYDLSLLFETENDYVLSYNEDFKVFENKNNKFKVGDFLYLSDYKNNKSLATVNSTYNAVASLNFLFNPSSLVNLKIDRGPRNQLGLNFSYDFVEKDLSVSGEYFYLKSLFAPFDTTYLGLSSTLFYDLSNNTVNDISIDSNLLIEFPLSILFKSTFILNSATIYSKAKFGVLLYNDFALHSAFEIGYKQYLSTNFKIGLSYKIDSKNYMYNTILFATEILF